MASSTVGIAATGLALGRPDTSTPLRPTSKKRKVGDFADINGNAKSLSSPISRPATSSNAATPDNRHSSLPLGSSPANLSPVIHQRPMTSTRAESYNNSGGSVRRWPTARHTELSSSQERAGEETRRDSISSRSSWIRRLSIIPTSQNPSPRSSVGPDSPSLAMPNGSVAPILSNTVTSPAPAPLPPNKLVKRVPSQKLSHTISRSGSNSQAPTLRRPATSHQRSVTLQQQFREHFVEPSDQLNSTPSKSVNSMPSSKSSSPAPQPSWRPFFESRPTKITKERSPGRSNDGGSPNFSSTSRRVLPDDAVRPSLILPDMISDAKTSYTAYYDEDSLPVEEDEEHEEDLAENEALPSTENEAETHKRARRALSMTFTSPGWGILRSGSIRGKKNRTEERTGGKRYASAPVSTTVPGRRVTSSHGSAPNGHRAITDPSVFQKKPESGSASPTEAGPVTSFQRRGRNASSPLPPLSRLSSFNVDLSRLGLSSSSSSAPRRSPNSLALQTQTTATSYSSPGNSAPTSPLYHGPQYTKLNRDYEAAEQRGSVMAGSESDGKTFALGDEDDMDFQSETVYDSLRSGTTGSMRSHSAQLDQMFDESPPSIIGSKSKRLSIHELLNGLRDGSDRIVEEDEGMSTPVKGARSRSSQEANLRTPVRNRPLGLDDNIKSSPPSFSLASKDFGRLSLDDEEDDEDWTRDDDNPEVASLSHPSSSLNSRRVSPSFRAALADLTYSSSINEVLPSIERPKSNLFDWSEPPSNEKPDLMGNSPRPQTAYTKKALDGRGGRAVGRRGPNALHIRSQSVPVVPDVNGTRENAKLPSKFGTWGLGGKGVSEEWDGDFEFDSSGDNTNQGDTHMENSGMIVPKAIQASQQQIVGHVGQIREVCLLVDDLKRLRGLAREKDLLGGESAHLWTEAEGIIALAVPDEEEATVSSGSPTSSDFEPEEVGGVYIDSGFDGQDLATDTPFEVLSHHGQPTGFIYDGSTVRRRSVFSPDDDIFGAGTIINPPVRDHLRPPSTSPRHSHSQKASSEYARSVMETMHQHRAVSDPLLPEMIDRSPNKMPFDTTSLRDLVNRASVLSRQLSELIRRADGSQSPEVNRRDREASPAILNLTRAFTPTADSTGGSPKHLPRSQSNNSVLSGALDASPTRALGQRMHMMTVV